MDMHEAKAWKMSDVSLIAEAKILVNNYAYKMQNEAWIKEVDLPIWNYLQFLMEAYKYDFSFKGVQAWEILGHSGGDSVDTWKNVAMGSEKLRSVSLEMNDKSKVREEFLSNDDAMVSWEVKWLKNAWRVEGIC